MTGTILLPFLVIVIATVSVYIAWQNLSSKKWGERAVLIACYVIVLAICLRYSNILKSMNSGFRENLENFEVNMPDPQEIIDEESEKNYKPGEAAAKSVSGDNRDPEPSGPIKFESTNEINKFATGTDLPGLASNKVDKFEDISQSETSGTSSIFRPQIVFNGVEGMQIVRPTAKGSDYVEGPASNGFGNVGPATTKASTISEYLKPNDELFGNTSSGSSSSDAFDWMETFLRRNVNVVGNQKTDACNYNKPYASDEGMAKKVDPLTLTDGSYVPGMTYLPPSNWAVPQYDQTSCRYPCVENELNTRRLPIGIMDHGTPVFALEIGSDGTIAKTEEEVRLTNVGSILPKFIYRQYVECPNDSYMGGPSAAGSCTTTLATTTTRPTTTRATTTTTRPTTTRATTTTTRPTTTTGAATTTSTRGNTTTTGAATTTTGAATTTSTRGNTTTTAKITIGSVAGPPGRP